MAATHLERVKRLVGRQLGDAVAHPLALRLPQLGRARAAHRVQVLLLVRVSRSSRAQVARRRSAGESQKRRSRPASQPARRGPGPPPLALSPLTMGLSQQKVGHGNGDIGHSHTSQRYRGDLAWASQGPSTRTLSRCEKAAASPRCRRRPSPPPLLPQRQRHRHYVAAPSIVPPLERLAPRAPTQPRVLPADVERGVRDPATE